MSGRRSGLVVGRRLSLDDCHFYYRLCSAGTREVLVEEIDRIFMIDRMEKHLASFSLK